MKTPSAAIQFRSPGDPVLIEVETPEPAPGEVRLQMIATSLCNHSELRSFSGGSSQGYGSCYPMLPGEPGHEGVGRVTETGEGVAGLAPGDLVALTGWGGEPAHRGVLLRDAREVARIVPGDRDPAPASILEMFASAYHCIKPIWHERRLENRRVAIIGLGAIGLCSLQLLRLWPVGAILGIDTRRSKRTLAEQMGADEVYEPTTDTEALVRRLGQVGIVIECTGKASGQELAGVLAADVQINVSYVTEQFMVDQSRWFNATTTIYNPGLPQSEDLRAVATLYNRQLLDPASMVTYRIPPEIPSYIDAIKAISAGEVVKVLIEWESAGARVTSRGSAGT